MNFDFSDIGQAPTRHIIEVLDPASGWQPVRHNGKEWELFNRYTGQVMESDGWTTDPNKATAWRFSVLDPDCVVVPKSYIRLCIFTQASVVAHPEKYTIEGKDKWGRRITESITPYEEPNSPDDQE